MKSFIFLLLFFSFSFADIGKMSKSLLGKEYGFSPLGEGKGIDSDPRIRTDKFDCTTYVETVVALSKDSRNPLHILDSIRYQGKPDFYNRRHFPAFWIKTLIKEGFFEDVTSEFQVKSQSITKTINQRVWEKREPKFLEDFNTTKIPNSTYTLEYISLVDLKDIEIKEPLVFSMIRENKENKPIIITHQGFLVPSEGKILVRHARSKPINKVVEEPLEDFVERVGGYKSWKVLGLNLLRIK